MLVHIVATTGVDAGPGAASDSGGFNSHGGLDLYVAPWVTLWFVVVGGGEVIVCCSIVVLCLVCSRPLVRVLCVLVSCALFP